MTASCEDLLASYVERGVHRVTPWGWDTGVTYLEGDVGTAEDSSASGLVRCDVGGEVQECIEKTGEADPGEINACA